MARYPNGRIPDHELITFKTGWNSAEGTWKHQLTPGGYAKHLRLVSLAKARTGRTLTIGDGWGAYRPIAPQEYARKIYGTGAAVVGTSSHGGNWYDGPRGWRESMAADYDNWGWVYDWDRDAFYEDVRAAGLVPGLIHPSRGNGYPDEPWHVVDLDPWSPPISGKAVSPATKSEEDEDMPDSMFANVDGVPSWCWLNWATGSLYAVHTQKDADWIGGYMGSVRFNWANDPIGGDKYKNKLALFGILCPKVKIDGASLTATDLSRIQAIVNAGSVLADAD